MFIDLSFDKSFLSYLSLTEYSVKSIKSAKSRVLAIYKKLPPYKPGFSGGFWRSTFAQYTLPSYSSAHSARTVADYFVALALLLY